MDATELARGDDLALLRAAAGGDEDAFARLVQAHRAELLAHCYRMLGSLADAEDVLQDALLHAWRGLPGFAGRGSVRSWLFSIVTNATIDRTRRASRRELPVSFGPAAGPGDDLGESVDDPIWLESFPDRLLPEYARSSPAARYEQRESVELAFMVALQELPPLQRAVILLREVLGFSAAEIAAQLGTSPAAVSSALHRGRARLQRLGPVASQQSVLASLGDEATRLVVEQYADALERGDADALVSMLTQDATWSMPPIPTWFRGHERIREFLVRWPLTDTWRHVPVRANGQLAVACYLLDPASARFIPGVFDVLTMAAGKIAGITSFLTPEMLGRRAAGRELSGAELFARFGLPPDPPS